MAQAGQAFRGPSGGRGLVSSDRGWLAGNRDGGGGGGEQAVRQSRAGVQTRELALTRRNSPNHGEF